MEFVEIMSRQATHKILHVGGAVEEKDQNDLSCRTCYPIIDQPKHKVFDRFWGLIEQLDLNVKGYFRQTIFAFNKLAELSFDKGKPHNTSLIAGIRAILIILKYDANLKVDATMVIFQMGILLKRSKFLTTELSDD